MAKTKKKRNKRYTGAGAAQAGPVIHRYEAADRGRLGQYVYERKGRIRVAGILAAIAGFIALLVSAVSGLFT